MKAEKSPLVWEGFSIFSWDFSVVPPEDPETFHFEDVAENHGIDVDFEHYETEDSSRLQVHLKIGINNIEPVQPGYKIFIHCGGIFNVEEVNKLDEAPRKSFRLFATTNLLIGRVRELISILTGQAMYGPYELPSLDLNDLFKKKRKEVEETESE